MALIRQPRFLTARMQFILDITYVGIRDNVAADALRRNDIVRFRRLATKRGGSVGSVAGVSGGLAE